MSQPASRETVSQRQVEFYPVMRHLRRDPPAFEADQAIARHRSQRARQVGFCLPVIFASSSSEPGVCSTITRSRSRWPADSTLAKDSVEVNHTFGSSGLTHRSPCATAMVRAFMSLWLALVWPRFATSSHARHQGKMRTYGARIVDILDVLSKTHGKAILRELKNSNHSTTCVRPTAALLSCGLNRHLARLRCL